MEAKRRWCSNNDSFIVESIFQLRVGIGSKKLMVAAFAGLLTDFLYANSERRQKYKGKRRRVLNHQFPGIHAVGRIGFVCA
jgi:hypothetical protein